MKLSKLFSFRPTDEAGTHGSLNVLSDFRQNDSLSIIEMSSVFLHRQGTYPLRTEARSSYCEGGERILDRSMGGEIYDLIERFEGKDFNCIGHLPTSQEPVGSWYGYPHDGGLADAMGNRWWAYQRCRVSGYQTAWWKVERLLIPKDNDMRVGNSKHSGSTRNSKEIITDSHIDYYRLLCVEPSASLLQIRKNYRYLVKRFHPDLTTVEDNNELEIIKSINEAYEILSDPLTRLQYDRTTIRKVCRK